MTDHKLCPSSFAAAECPLRIEVLPGNSASWTTKVRCSAGITHSSANFHGSTGEDLVGRGVISIAKRGAQEEKCQLAKNKFLPLQSLPRWQSRQRLARACSDPSLLCLQKGILFGTTSCWVAVCDLLPPASGMAEEQQQSSKQTHMQVYVIDLLDKSTNTPK